MTFKVDEYPIIEDHIQLMVNFELSRTELRTTIRLGAYMEEG